MYPDWIALEQRCSESKFTITCDIRKNYADAVRIHQTIPLLLCILLLCLLFCVDLREQNPFCWCLALEKAGLCQPIYFNDLLFFAKTRSKKFDEFWKYIFIYFLYCVLMHFKSKFFVFIKRHYEASVRFPKLNWILFTAALRTQSKLW